MPSALLGIDSQHAVVALEQPVLLKSRQHLHSLLEPVFGNNEPSHWL